MSGVREGREGKRSRIGKKWQSDTRMTETIGVISLMRFVGCRNGGRTRGTRVRKVRQWVCRVGDKAVWEG